MSDDSRSVYSGRDTAASSLLSQSLHSSFPVALKLLTSLFFSLETTVPLFSQNHKKGSGQQFVIEAHYKIIGSTTMKKIH